MAFFSPYIPTQVQLVPAEYLISSSVCLGVGVNASGVAHICIDAGEACSVAGAGFAAGIWCWFL